MALNGNTYWYLGLTLVSLILLVFMLVRKDKFRVLALSLILTQIAYLIETVIYIFGGSYEYHPEMLRSSPYYDSNMGALTSNMLIIPLLGCLIALFRLRWIWITLIIAMVAAVEWWFVKLQLYTLHWWRIEYTSAGLFFYFGTAKWFGRKLGRPLQGWMRAFFVLLCTSPFLGTLHILPIMLLGNRAYTPGWFADINRDTTAFAALFYPFSALMAVLTLEWPYGRKATKLLGLGTAAALIHLLLKRTGVLASYVWWDPVLYVAMPLIGYFFSDWVRARLSAVPREEVHPSS